MHIKNYHNYEDPVLRMYCDRGKTERQWNLLGFKVKEDAEEMMLWTNHICQWMADYYIDEDVIPMTEEELKAFKAEQRERQRQYKINSKKRKIRLEKERQEMIEYCKKQAEEEEREREKERLERIERRKKIFPHSEEVYIPDIENRLENLHIAVIDLETTGLSHNYDEVIQVSIIDQDYNCLLNVLCKPQNRETWDDAMRVNHITPAMVDDHKPFEEYKELVQKILDAADIYIAYNSDFEYGFLGKYGIKTQSDKWVDPMFEFAEIYGEWNDYYESYKWQSLTTMAGYYGYEFKAHDSLEDVKATLYGYYKMTERKELDEAEDEQEIH